MDHRTRRRLGGAATTALAALVFVGCTTTPKKSTVFQDPEVGYAVASHMRQPGERARYAQEIAERRLRKLRAPSTSASAAQILAYRKQLLAPIVLDTAAIARSGELDKLDAATRDGVARLLQRPLEISGATASPQWRQAAEAVERRVGSLRAGLLKAAEDEATGKRNFRAALDRCLEYREIAPGDKSVIERMDRYKQLWVDTVASEIETENLGRVRRVQESFQNAKQSTFDKIKSCYPLLDKAESQVEELRAFFDANREYGGLSAKQAGRLGGLETAVVDARGRCWAEWLWLAGTIRQYWDAYTICEQFMALAAAYPPAKADALRAQLGDAYAKLLPEGAAFFVNRANDQFANDAFGLAIVYCRMAEELVDYARQQGFKVVPDATTWYDRAIESRADARKKLEKSMQRRVFVGNLLGAEGLELTRMVSEAFERHFVAGDPDSPYRVWAVTLASSTDKPEARDYVLDGSVTEISVEESDVAVGGRRIISVGLDPQRTLNPAYNPRSTIPEHAHPYRYEQMAVLYEQVTRQQSRQARIRISTTLAHDGRKRVLWTENRRFTGDEKDVRDLGNVRLSWVQDTLSAPISGPTRISYESGRLTREPLPTVRHVPATKVSDIKDALRRYAADRIIAALNDALSPYPVSDLAASALRFEEAGDNVRAGDAWGRCLAYCYEMSIPHWRGSAGVSRGNWLSERQALQAEIDRQLAGDWSQQGAAARARFGDLWAVAVKGALASVRE